MNRIKTFLFSVLLAVAAGTAGASGEPGNIRFEGVEITPLPLPAMAGSSGYSAISAKIRNTLAVPVEVGIRVSGRSFGADGRVAMSENSATVRPGSETVLSGPCPNSWNRAEVGALSVGGKILPGAPELFPTFGGGRHKTVMLEVKPDAARAANPPPPEQAAARARERLQLRQSFDAVTEAYSPVSQWSADPLAYTGFAMISIPESEFSAAPPEVRLALEKYMLLGGTLELTAAKRAFPREAMFGEYIGSLPLPEPLPRTAFGSGPGCPELADIGLSDAAASTVTLGVLVLFAAGTATLAITLRRKNKLWLFAAVPAASLLAAAAISTAVRVREGAAPRLAIESKTVIDAATGIAATEAEYLVFAPVGQNPALEFSGDTLITAPVTADYRWDGGRLRLEGMLSTHAPTRLTARRIFKTGAGIDLTFTADGRPHAVNRLGAAATELFCRIDGKEFAAPSGALPIPDGGAAELIPSGRRPEAGPDGFTAKLAASPFVEPGLTKLPAAFSSRATVCGTFARKEQP